MCCFVFSRGCWCSHAQWLYFVHLFLHIRWKRLHALSWTNKNNFPLIWGLGLQPLWTCGSLWALKGKPLSNEEHSQSLQTPRLTAATSYDARAQIHIEIMIHDQAVDPYRGAAEIDGGSRETVPKPFSVTARSSAHYCHLQDYRSIYSFNWEPWARSLLWYIKSQTSDVLRSRLCCAAERSFLQWCCAIL